MSDISYYAIRLVGEMVYYVDQNTGETIKQKLLEYHADDPFRQEFIEFEDISGSDVCLQLLEIESLYLSTPKTRETDINGPLAEIQKIIDERKDWDD